MELHVDIAQVLNLKVQVPRVSFKRKIINLLPTRAYTVCECHTISLVAPKAYLLMPLNFSLQIRVLKCCIWPCALLLQIHVKGIK